MPAETRDDVKRWARIEGGVWHLVASTRPTHAHIDETRSVVTTACGREFVVVTRDIATSNAWFDVCRRCFRAW